MSKWNKLEKYSWHIMMQKDDGHSECIDFSPSMYDTKEKLN